MHISEEIIIIITRFIGRIKYVRTITCSAGCAAAPSTVLRATGQSYGKRDFSTPHCSAPKEPIKTTFGTRDYVAETTPPANLLALTALPSTVYPLERDEI